MNPRLHRVNRLALTLALACAPLGVAHATFPGENGVIVYGNASGWITKISPSGGTPTPLAQGQDPAVSPNGKKIAYAKLISGRWQIFVMNIDGSGTVPVTEGRLPAWSPDGTQLAFSGYCEGFVGVCTSSANGENRVLLDPAADVRRISWSPLGDKADTFAHDFFSDYYNARWTLVTKREGQSWTTMAVTPGGYDQPSWSPDGRSLIVAHFDNPSCAYKANPDGSSVGGANLQPMLPCDYSVVASTLSPDQQQLLTVTGDRNSPGWYVVPRPVAGGNPKWVATGDGRAADWSRVPKTAMRTTLVNGQWTAVNPLALDADTYIEQSAVTVMPSVVNHVVQQVVGIGSDGRVYHRWQSDNGTWSPFALVSGIGGDSAGIRAKRVAIAGARDGSSQLVIVGADDLVYHAMRYANGSWSGFGQLNGYDGAANFAARDVAIAINSDSSTSAGNAQVLANGLSAGAVLHRVRFPAGNWSSWYIVPGSPYDTQDVAIATLNGDVYMIATHSTQGIMRQRWNNAGGAWDGWVSVGGTYTGIRDVAMTIGYSASGQPVAKLAYVDAAGATWYQERPNPAAQSAWTPAVNETSPVKNTRAVSISGPELLAVQVQSQ